MRAAWLTIALVLAPAAAAQGPGGLAWRDPPPQLPAGDPPYGAKAILGRFKDPVQPLAFSADGKLLAFIQAGVPTLGVPCPLYLIDVATGQVVQTLRGHHTAVSCAAFAPDGKTLATGGTDNDLRFWDVATGKPVGEPQRQSNHVNSVCWTPDGKKVVAASSELRVYDSAAQQVAGGFAPPRLPNTEFFTAVLSPDGKTLVSRSAYRIRIWDFVSGKQLHEIEMNDYGPHQPVITADGRFLIDNEPPYGPQKWEIATGLRLPPGRKLAKGEELPSYTFSPDGTWRARQAHVKWGQEYPPLPPTWYVSVAAEGKATQRLATHDEPAHLLFNADGTRLAWGGKNGSLTLWGCTTGQLLRTLCEEVRPVRGLHFSQGGARLLSLTADGLVREWDVAGGKEVRRADLGLPEGDLFHTGTAGKVLAPVRRHLGLWDLATGRLPGTYADEFPLLDGFDSPRLVVGFSANGNYLAGVIFDSPEDGGAPRVAVWNTRTGQRVRSPRIPAGGRAVTVSNDGRMLASDVLADDGEAHFAVVWEAASGKPRLKARVPADKKRLFSPEAIHLSPDGRYVALVELCHGWRVLPDKGPPQPIDPGESRVHVWEIATGRLVQTLQGRGLAVAFSPDSTRLAAALGFGLSVLDLQSGKTGHVESHQAAVRCLAWRDGRLLASAGDDGAVVMWEADELLARRQE
jgi:WD40 repeat protein